MPPFASLLGGSRGVSPGQMIALIGQGFNQTTSVLVGSAPAAFAKALSDTYLIAAVPTPPIATIPVQGNITVVTRAGNFVTPQVVTTGAPCGTVLCPLGPRLP